MGKVIAIANEKGGVGKTTTALTLGDILAKLGYKVLLVDNDPQGNLTLALRGDKEGLEAHVQSLYQKKPLTPIVIKEKLHLIGANKNLGTELDKGFEIIYDFADALDKYRDRYDYILIDCVPSTSYFLTASLLAANYVIIPVIPEPFAINGLSEVLDTVQKFQNPRFNPQLKILGVFINSVPGKKTVITRELIEGARALYKNMIFKNEVTRSTVVVESPTSQQSIVDYSPGHKLTKQFTAVAQEMLSRIRADISVEALV